MPENKIAPNEVAVQEETELVKVANASGVEKSKAQYVLDKFTQFFADAAECEKAVAGIVVTDASQVAMMNKAKTTRLQLKEIRCAAENVRKSLKAGILVEGKLIDSMYNIIEGITKPLETKLQEQEDFIERQEAKRKADLAAERLEKLAPYIAEGVTYDLANMTQETFDNLLKNSKIAKDAIAAANAKAEQERIEKETKEREERERIAAENERLKKENEEQRIAAEKAQAEKQRELDEANAKTKAAEEEARLAAEKLEAEKKAAQKKLDDEAAEKARFEAEAKAKAAAILASSDSEKIQNYFDALMAVELPAVNSAIAQQIVTGTVSKLREFKEYAKTKLEAV